jgi:hypothetical protein
VKSRNLIKKIFKTQQWTPERKSKPKIKNIAGPVCLSLLMDSCGKGIKHCKFIKEP